MSITDVRERDDDVNPRKVGWTQFVWAIALVTGMMGTGFVWTFNAVASAEKRVAAAEAKLDAFQGTLGPIANSLGKIEVNVEWIKGELERLRQQPRR
jgi:hypothetical protein